MNFKTLPELKKVLSGDIFKHVGLYTADGQKIKPFNSKFAAYQDNVKDILNYLNSEIVDPGVYVVKVKKSYTGAAQEYGFNKGNVTLNENVDPMPKRSILNIPDDFSAAINHPAVKLQSDITRLELENEDLQRQIEELNEYIGELEGKLSEQTLSEAPKEPTTFEAAKSFLTELVSFGAPLLDKHFELKQQQLEIERARVNRGTAAPAAPAPAATAPGLIKLKPDLAIVAMYLTAVIAAAVLNGLLATASSALFMVLEGVFADMWLEPVTDALTVDITFLTLEATFAAIFLIAIIALSPMLSR